MQFFEAEMGESHIKYFSWQRVDAAQIVAGCLLIIAAPVLVLLAGLVWLVDGRPVFYRSRRLGKSGQPFDMWKLRTMRPSAGGCQTTGGPQNARITPLGSMLRRLHFDEIPQLFNVLKGDMRIIGLRAAVPRQYNCNAAQVAQLFHAPPGITSLASVYLWRWEAKVLGQCRSTSEVERVYHQRCLPRKLRLERLYSRNPMRLLPLVIAATLLPIRPARLRRIRYLFKK